MSEACKIARLSALALLLILAPSPHASAQTRAPRILSGSEMAGQEDIFVMDTDGSNQSRLVTVAIAPVWSRDGCRVVIQAWKTKRWRRVHSKTR